MAGLEYINVKGFKSLKSIELRLRPITLLIGANGSGKSNFIEVFRFLDSMRDGELLQYVAKEGRANNLLHFGSRFTKRLEIKVGLADDLLTYHIGLEPTSDDFLTYRIGLQPTSDTLLVKDQTIGTHGIPGYPDEDSPVEIPDDPTTGDPTFFLPSIWRAFDSPFGDERYRKELFDGHQIYEFSESFRLKSSAHIEDNRRLKPDGSNIPAFLYYLKERHRESYRRIVGTVSQMAPFFTDFDLEPDRLNPFMIRLRWKHAGSDDYFDASSLSSGTLRFIALATLLLQPSECMPHLIIVDEAELGLHPQAITILGSLIRRASIDTRLIVATQSPLLVDQFEPEDVVVVDRVDGASEFKRLESAELETWLEDYSLGELWQKNNLGGRPSRE